LRSTGLCSTRLGTARGTGTAGATACSSGPAATRLKRHANGYQRH
jgi:hypothetical protein